MINNNVILTMPHIVLPPPMTRAWQEKVYTLSILKWSDFVSTHNGNTAHPEAVRLSAEAEVLKAELYEPLPPQPANNSNYVRSNRNLEGVQDAKIKQDKALPPPRGSITRRPPANALGVYINGVRLRRTAAPAPSFGFKVCLHCGGEPQPHANFSQNVTKCDGRRAECKACQKKERDEKADAKRVLLGQAPRIVSGVLHVCDYGPCLNSFRRPKMGTTGIKHFCSLICYDKSRGDA